MWAKLGNHKIGGRKAQAQSAGSALIVTVLLITVLCLVAATLLSYTRSKQSGPFQAASWHEAGAAAEGGIEIALNALRRSITDGTVAWNGWVDNPAGGATAKKYITDTQLLGHQGEGNTVVRAIVEISQPTGAGTINPTTGTSAVSPNRYAYLIRSTGFANVPGPTRIATDKSDADLRKLNVFRDMRTNSTITTPQVSRVVEAIASPVTPFPAAILAKDTIEIKGGSGMIVDSYDPTITPYKYDLGKARGDATQPGNKRSNGNIATNAKKKNNGEVIRLENVQVWGLAAKGAGVVNIKTANASVSGEIIDGFYRELKPVQDPSKIAGFSGLTASTAADRPGNHSLPKTVTVTCGNGASSANPAQTNYYKFKKVHLHTGEILSIKKGSTPYDNVSWGSVEIWITDDVVIHNGGLITIEDGAQATIYFGRNLTLQEKDSGHPAITNNTQLKTYSLTNTNSTFDNVSALQFYGSVPDHKKKHVKIKTNMSGVVYAPDHDFEVNLKSGRHLYGALTGRKFTIKSGTQVHYDETLSDLGKPIDYTLETWQEDWYDPAVRTVAH
jgi:hypothetical protein